MKSSLIRDFGHVAFDAAKEKVVKLLEGFVDASEVAKLLEACEQRLEFNAYRKKIPSYLNLKDQLIETFREEAFAVAKEKIYILLEAHQIRMRDASARCSLFEQNVGKNECTRGCY
jgi:hypothetical protein